MGKNVPLKNSAVALVSRVALVAGGFFLQATMANALGQENLGLNSVFTNIVSLLSLAEMGIATAIVYNLYAPLENRDEAAISALMRLFARAYRAIGLAVAAIGLMLMPFVHIFLKDSTFSLGYVRGVFLLFLLQTVLSYFLSYKRSLIIADQRAYVVNTIDMVSHVISAVGGILIIKFTQSFIWYLLYAAIVAFLANAAIAICAKKLYPNVNYREKIPEGVSAKVFGNVRNVFIMKLSGAILNSTDSLIISSFVGVMASGLYDNYYKLTAAIMAFLSAMATAVQPTLGHMFVTDTKKSLDGTLKNYTFILYMISSFCGVSLLCLMTPFITDIWLSPQYEMEFRVVAICAVNFFLMAVRQPIWSMLEVSGLFAQNRNTSLVGAGLNLIISLALVKPLGMFGVFIGTFVSQAAQVVLKTRVLYKTAFELSARGFVTQFVIYFAIFFAECAAAYAICSRLGGGIAGFFTKMAVCAALPNAVNLIIYYKTDRFTYLLKTFVPKLAAKRGA